MIIKGMALHEKSKVRTYDANYVVVVSFDRGQIKSPSSLLLPLSESPLGLPLSFFSLFLFSLEPINQDSRESRPCPSPHDSTSPQLPCCLNVRGFELPLTLSYARAKLCAHSAQRALITKHQQPSRHRLQPHSAPGIIATSRHRI